MNRGVTKKYYVTAPWCHHFTVDSFAVGKKMRCEWLSKSGWKCAPCFDGRVRATFQIVVYSDRAHWYNTTCVIWSPEKHLLTRRPRRECVEEAREQSNLICFCASGLRGLDPDESNGWRKMCVVSHFDNKSFLGLCTIVFFSSCCYNTYLVGRSIVASGENATPRN